MTVSYVQAKGNTGAGITLDAAPTDGNLLTWFVTSRTTDIRSTTPTGWTILSTVTNFDGDGSHTRFGVVYYKIASGDDAAFADFTSLTGICMWIFEWAAGVTLDTATVGSISDQVGTVVTLGGPITPSIAEATVVGNGLLSAGDPGWETTPASGVTELFDQPTGGAFSPHIWVGIKTDQTGATTVSGTMVGSSGWGGITYAVLAPPEPGMWLDFNRDGFKTAGSPSTSPRLVRMLPQATASAITDNVTDDVMSVQIDRTVDRQGGSAVGTMTVTTKNPSGKYNPDNSASSVYGKINPGTPVWFGCNSDLTLSGTAGSIYGRFAGRLRTVAPIPEPGATDAPTVEWIFDDAMARYREGKARVAFSSTRTVKTYRTAVLASISETHLDLDTEADTLPASGVIGIKTGWLSRRAFQTLLSAARAQVAKRPTISALSVLEDLNHLVGTRHFVAPSDSKDTWYAYTTRNRQHGLGSAASAALTAMVSDTSGYVHGSDGIENTINVEVRPFRVPGQASTVWSSGDVPFPLHTGTSLTIVADFGDQVFDAAVTVTSTTGTASASMVTYGDGAVILLTTTAPTHVLSLSIDGRLVDRQDPFSVERSDSGSIAAYGEMQGQDVTSDLMTSSGMAEGIADYHLWANAAPRKSPSVQIINHPSTLLPLELCDIVTLTIPQIDVTARRFEVLGIHERWEVAASASLALVTFTLDLRETPVQSVMPLLTFGTSTYGGADVFTP